jgi:outer membrane immunogenic protein
MKTSFLIAAVVGATALAAPARAADIAETAGPVAYDWSGVYAGISGGHGWTDVTQGWITSTFRGLGTWAGDVDETLSANGGLIGATIGLNHQFDKVVIGLEADISYASMGTDGQAFDGNIWAPGDSSVETWRTELEWLGTIRGRAGYAFDRFLVYGTAGLAIGGAVDKTRFDYDNGSGSSRSVAAQDRNTHLGWTAGRRHRGCGDRKADRQAGISSRRSGRSNLHGEPRRDGPVLCRYEHQDRHCPDRTEVRF